MDPAHVFTGQETRQQLQALAESDNRANRRRATSRLKDMPASAPGRKGRG